jgi:predicted amidohydrolase
MAQSHSRRYDFTQPLDESWEALPKPPAWTCEIAPGCCRITGSRPDGRAEIYIRPCSIEGDTLEVGLIHGATRAGVFMLGFLSGFEFIRLELNLTNGTAEIHTHEWHKAQPRVRVNVAATVGTAFTNIKLHREADSLPGLPYPGAAITLLLDDKPVLRVPHVDFLPESLVMLGVKGVGQVSLSHFALTGPPRPRPEYVSVGIFQSSPKLTTAANVDGLIDGVRQAAEAGVRILVTPETSITGLRCEDPEMYDRKVTQAELARFQRAVSQIKDAPYTLVGYPDWVDGSEVDGAELPEVCLNVHRFVRPDGVLGPRMAKVHTCEDSMWHGRNYNCQRVDGVIVALGICHDGHYADVWNTGVMAGARLCLHPSAGGAGKKGPIAPMIDAYRNRGTSTDSFWAMVNAFGGGAIIYPSVNASHPDTVLAVTKDLTEANPSYPNYQPMGDSLAHARIRLWEATGAYPLRTLRNGRRHYELWKQLMPPVVDV